MTAQFLIQQLDYIFFFYGLAFILLMAVCAIMFRQGEKTELPWMLLGGFGLVHGINEWLDMLAISLGDDSRFSTVRLAIMLVSFVFLAEFGRQGLKCKGGKSPGAWIYLPFLVCVVAGGSAGMPELNATVRYTFGLCGGLMAARALWRAAHVDVSTRLLASAAVIMVLYAVASGAVVPKASFFPASWLNHNTFLASSGMPIQLLRGILAVFFTSVVWRYHQQSKHLPASDGDLAQNRSGKLLTFIVLVLLSGGWVATDLIGMEAIREVRSDILQLTRTAAAAISAERVGKLSGTPADKDNPDYTRLRRQLFTLNQVNPHVHRLRLLFLKDGQIRIAADSAADWERDHSDPGADYQQSSHDPLGVFASGESRTAAPYKNKVGTFISGFAPLFGADGDRPIAVLGVDVGAAGWHKMEARYRLLAIITTLIFSTVITGFFIVRQRMLESAQLLAYSRKKLEEARLQRQLELEAMNQKLEERVTLRTAKLAASNRELQHFAYIASHDLQEPLRTITSFVQLLAKRYQGKIDKDADEFIGFITDGTRRMKSLINDLLEYSRVESSVIPFDRFDGGTALDLALGNLRQSIEKSGAVITSDRLPTMFGDETQIVLLMQNLIGNAIKFHGERPPEIHVGFRDMPEEWEISVRDNGIGIGPEYFDRIFIIFQRLHTMEQYTGTGIGLAVCKKIVERHGGKINVDSEPGKGTTFTFTISKLPRPAEEVML